MRANPLIPTGMFIGGILLVIGAVATGEAEVSLVLIFPVFSGSSGLFLLGVLLIVMSFFVGFAMIATGQIGTTSDQAAPVGTTGKKDITRDTEYGGVVLIGPVPIAFGSSRKIALIMLAIGIVMAVLVLGLILAL